MPRLLLPEGESFEAERDGCFLFDIEIALPFAGLIVAYRGELKPSLSIDRKPAAELQALSR